LLNGDKYNESLIIPHFSHSNSSKYYEKTASSFHDLLYDYHLHSSTILSSSIIPASDFLLKVVCENLAQKKFKSALNDLNNESDILKKCSHPHIIQIFGFGEQPHPFLMLEHLTGGTLADMLLTSTSCSNISSCSSITETVSVKSCTNSIFHLHTLPISYDRALHVSRSLSRALQYLHEDWSPEFAVVHRNLRPESIGFSGDGHLKLFDFTMAAQLNKSGSDIETLFGKVGSLRYMAPEMFLVGSYTEKVDVYSFGLILWQLITCRKPFQGYTSDQLKSEVNTIIILCSCCYNPPIQFYPAVLSFSLIKVLTGGSRPDLCDGQFALSEPLRELVTSCWASNPCDRPSFRIISEQLEILNNVHKKTKLSPRNKGRPNSLGEPCKSSRENLLSHTNVASDDADH
jgi:serine/threonine protein kinase